MDIKLEKARATANFTRFRRNQSSGHYESYFMRANSPDGNQAFWVRYTIYHGNPVHKATGIESMGELWAIYFEKGKAPIAAKSEFDLSKADFSNTHFGLNFNDSILNDKHLKGSAQGVGTHSIQWELDMASISSAKNAHPLFPMPLDTYDAPLPRAKLLVAQPFLHFNGVFIVNGKKISVKNWQGSQNHNWGSRHTDEYAWGQVAGFDNDPDAFLEVASAKLKFGPVMTPYLTPIVLRLNGKDYALNSYWNAFRNKAKVSYFDWTFSGENDAFSIEGKISASRDDFVPLKYYNPPGDVKTCLNSKIASCEIIFREKGRIGISKTLKTASRAAFEILTSKTDHGFTHQV